IAFMNRVGGGDLEAKAAFGGSREFRDLAEALNRMIADLRDRLRLRHSLQVATEVQQRLLPQGPPRVRGLDIAGHSTYCDETGGDYYDFLLLEEAAPDTVLVALGDVMGHGVAAAPSGPGRSSSSAPTASGRRRTSTARRSARTGSATPSAPRPPPRPGRPPRRSSTPWRRSAATAGRRTT